MGALRTGSRPGTSPLRNRRPPRRGVRWAVLAGPALLVVLVLAVVAPVLRWSR